MPRSPQQLEQRAMGVSALSFTTTVSLLTPTSRTDHPIAALWTFWTNETCSPFASGGAATCTRGYYGDYVILAKTRDHIKAGIDFARNNNLRLVIRNTGHDFMGRSTGWGSLIINTHSFKTVEFVENFDGPGDWWGGAAKIGAGVQVRELYRLANKRNPPVVIVGGECPVCSHFPWSAG